MVRSKLASVLTVLLIALAAIVASQSRSALLTFSLLTLTAIGLLPLFTICDRWDVGGVSTMLQGDTGLPTIAIYDGYPGGAGIADLGHEAADRHLPTTLDALRSCACPEE